MNHKLRSLLVALALITPLLARCGGRECAPPCDQSECGKVCLAIRDKLMNNLGEPPWRFECADASWQLDCEACEQLLKDRWDMAMPSGFCGTP